MNSEILKNLENMTGSMTDSMTYFMTRLLKNLENMTGSMTDSMTKLRKENYLCVVFGVMILGVMIMIM